VRPTRTVLLAVGAVAVAASAAVVIVNRRSDVAPTRPAAAIRTQLPGLTPPTGDPTLAGIDHQRPKTGGITLVKGPFDDRFTWSGAKVAAGAVTGQLRITSDVSDVLEVQVVAGFYDAAGSYLGLGRYTYHLDEEKIAPHSGLPSEILRFSVTAPPAVRSRAVAAAIGVPVLVNE